MNLADLNEVAQAMVAPGKGILAADESLPPSPNGLMPSA